MATDGDAHLALLLADPQRLADLAADQVPPLLGTLEQLRASLWARMLAAPAAIAREADVGAIDEILTVAHVADELKFTRSYVYEAIRRGDLTAVRKGKYVRVRRSDLRAWIDGDVARGLDGRLAAPDSSRHVPALSGPPSLPLPTARGSRRRPRAGAPLASRFPSPGA
jgi:excisionase family DNA binding protein